jgi:hypothetical protein
MPVYYCQQSAHSLKREHAKTAFSDPRDFLNPCPDVQGVIYVGFVLFLSLKPPEGADWSTILYDMLHTTILYDIPYTTIRLYDPLDLLQVDPLLLHKIVKIGGQNGAPSVCMCVCLLVCVC